MRKFLYFVGISLSVLGGPVRAYADTVNTFTLDATTQDGYVRGFLDIDVTTGLAGYGQFTFYVNEFPSPVQQLNYNGNLTTTCLSCSEPPASHTTYVDTSNSNLFFALEVVGDSLVGYGGGPLCEGIQCYGGGAGSLFRISRGGFSGDDQALRPANLVLVATATTPEPEGLILVGSGTFAVVGLLRRKAQPQSVNGA